MAAELLLPTARAADSNGNPYSGAKWTFYATGTLTPQSVYADAGLSTALGSEVTADSGGKFVPIYFDASLTYRGICKDASGSTTLHDIDPINDSSLSALGGVAGSSLVGFKQSGTGAIARTLQSKAREEASLWDLIPDSYRAAIEAGTSTQDVTSYINQALQNHRRVIVRRGTYRFASPILMGFSEQVLEFEDGAWFHPLNGSTHGIAVPHGLIDVALINPGLIGEATTATGATGIIWNSNSVGTAAYGSTTPDDMGGLIEHARLKGSTPGTNGWCNFLHANMVAGLTVQGLNGRGLAGIASGHGYGVICSGEDITLRDIDVDAVVTGQGRHGIYLGYWNAGADVSGFRIRNFRKSGFAMNTGVTDTCNNIRIADGLIEDTSLDLDISGTDGAISCAYQGGATHAGSGVSLSNIQIKNSGNLGVHFNGYDKLKLSNISVDGWGTAAGTHSNGATGLYILDGDDCEVANFRSYCSVAGGNAYVHVKVQQSDDFTMVGGGAYNRSGGAQTAGVHLDATAPGTLRARIAGFVINEGTGSFSSGRYINPTQNGSVVQYPKSGGMKTDTQTGADIVLDVSDGESVVVLNASATSILNMTPAGAGQAVTLIATGATQIKNNNFYIASVFNMDANDTITMVSNGAIWREVSRSVN